MAGKCKFSIAFSLKKVSSNHWLTVKNYSAQGTIKGKISNIAKGKNGFGYDPIFIPNGYDQTFGEMIPKIKMSIDHRFKAFAKIKKFFI